MAEPSPSPRRRDPRLTARFTDLHAQHYARLLAYVQRRVGDPTVAEDVTADVFRIAWEKADQTVPSPGWLFVTAKHLILKQRDAAIRVARLGQLMADDLARRLGSDAERERAHLVYEALDRLPEDQRELLMAYYWDGLSGAECGALLGCSAGAVFMRLTRARTQLRRHVDALEAES